MCRTTEHAEDTEGATTTMAQLAQGKLLSNLVSGPAILGHAVECPLDRSPEGRPQHCTARLADGRQLDASPFHGTALLHLGNEQTVRVASHDL